MTDPPRRRRGRPRAGESSGREAILAAATAEFETHGYDAATVRAIAARAGVDPALVHHHFGTKADLFGAVVNAPMRPDKDLPAILAGDPDQIGAGIVRYVLTTWDRPEVRRRGVALLRTAVGTKAGSPLLVGFLRREMLGQVSRVIPGPDAELRATLVASQIAGLLMTRYVLALEPIASTPVEDVVAWVGPTIQRYVSD